MPEIDLDKLHALIDVLQMQRNQANDAWAQAQADLICARQEIQRLTDAGQSGISGHCGP